MNEKSESSGEIDKKYLSREEILNAEEPLKSIQLPSGTVVQVKYLAYFLVQDIQNSIESDSDELKERRFSETVVRFLLRENDIQDLYTFSENDQEKIIEIAAQEFGCKDEFDEQPLDLATEIRFFQAAIISRDKFYSQISEIISSAISIQQDSMQKWFSEYSVNLKGLFEETRISSSISEMLQGINKNLLDQFRDIGQQSFQITKLVKDISKPRFDIGLLLGESLSSSIKGMLDSYTALMRDIVSIDEFSVYPYEIRYFPTVEMHNTSVVIGRLYLEDEEEWDEEIITPQEGNILNWLESLDESFTRMLEGARQTIYSQNPDRCRHFASSHRELCTHILHNLAPDENVSEWTDDPNHFHNERPTRRTRLSYIVRNYGNHQFVDFFISDFLNQMDLLNADQHRRGQEYTENELLLLHTRFLSALGFLMEIIGGS